MAVNFNICARDMKGLPAFTRFVRQQAGLVLFSACLFSAKKTATKVLGTFGRACV
jgi:hypothetical protein